MIYRIASKVKTFEFEALFECFIINEIIRLNEYLRTRFTFRFLKIENDRETDLIIERPAKSPILIEIKSKASSIRESDIKALQNLSSGFKAPQLFCLSLKPERRKIKDVYCLFWKDGLKEIFEGELSTMHL